MKTKISKTGQITIPVLLRLCLDARPGDEFEIEFKRPGWLELHILTKHRQPWQDWKPKPLPCPAADPIAENGEPR